MAKGDRFVVLTMDKQTGNAGGLSAHIDREVYDAHLDRMVTFRPKSVRDDSRTALNRECIEAAKHIGRTQAIWNRLKEEGFSRASSDKKQKATKGEKKTRKVKADAVIALCFICTSDEDTMKQIEREGRLDDWIDSTLDWFRQEFGDKNVVSAVLHMDETTPHLHVTVVPITYEKPKPRKEKPKSDDVKKRTYKKQEVTARLSAKDICNPVAMERWQTDYAQAMAPFGLQRGVVGSKQKRVPPAEWNLQQVNGQLMAIEKEIEKKKAEITKMTQASMFDKMFHSNLTPEVRKAFEEKDQAHKEEMRQATMATYPNGKPVVWVGGKDDGRQLTWEEYAKWLKEQERKKAAQAKASKDERIEYLEKETARYKNAYEDLAERLKPVKDLVLALLSLNFRKVIQIILDQWKAGAREFTKSLKDFIQEALSVEKTVNDRRLYVEDAFKGAKAIARTDVDWKAKEEDLKPLYEDAMRIADGTWQSYHSNRKLEDAAVKAVASLANTPNRRYWSQDDVEAVCTYLGTVPDGRRSTAIDRLRERAAAECDIRMESWLDDVISRISQNTMGVGHGMGLGG